MNSNQPSVPLTFDELSCRLRGVIDKLIVASKSLQDAIVSRDIDNIWLILEQQQEDMLEFDRYNTMWKQLVVDQRISTPEIDKIKNEIRGDILRLKSLGNNNASMVRSFLSVVRKALRSVSTGKSGATYGKRGKMNDKHSSLMVNRVG